MFRSASVTNRSTSGRDNITRFRHRRFAVQALEDRVAPAVFNVTSLDDSGINTLRGALIGSGITFEADTINIGVTGTITLQSELTIPGSVNIVGPGSGVLTVHGNQQWRVFNASNAPAGAVINISGLTVSSGKVTGNGAGLLIGDEAVTLTNCSFYGNVATGDGGAIHVSSAAGSLDMSYCNFAANDAIGAGNDGGAISIFAASTVTIDKSTISGNTAADDGAGIYFRQGGQFTITNSTIWDNAGGSASTAIGGGLYFFGTASGPLLMQNCTITDNTIGGSGGGIVLANFSGNLSLESCTVTGNSTTATGTTGGGIARTSGTGTLSMTSTVIAANKSQSGDGPDVSFNAFSVVTGNYNLIGVSDSSNALLSVINNQLGQKASPLNPQLGLCDFNGGPTRTRRPMSGSPLIDKGSSSFGFDQRGVTRVVGKSADIGAVEYADSFLVTNVNDDGPGSLRRAIADANLDRDIFNGINFDTTVFATPKTIALTTGELTITEGCGISGPGNVTIDAGNAGRHFNIDGTNLNVYLIGMTLTNGKSPDGQGGSIRVDDCNVFMNKMTVTNNVNNDGSGGGVFLLGSGNLQISDSTISNNQANSFFSSGGGIYFNSDGNLTVQRSRITGNSAYSSGGGICFQSKGALTVEDSTIDNNSTSKFPVQQGGGGVLFYGEGGTADILILNSTISSNHSEFGSGGGVLLRGAMDSLHIYNSTITGNTASQKGGGIYATGNTVGLISSIVSGNTAGTGKDIFTPGSVSSIQSAIGDADNIGLFGFDATTDSLIGVDLKLGPLANNGGETPTHLPAVDSPVVNQGTEWINLTNDQRGAGYMRERSGKIDIGAVEANTNLVVTNDNDAGAGSLRQAVLDANALVGPDTIAFDPVFFSTPKTITLSGELGINEAVTIAGPGATRAIVSGNNVTRIFNTIFALPDTPINIYGLTLAGGKAVDDGGFPFAGNTGGAIIASNESLTLGQCVLTGNTAPTGFGGAVAVLGGGTLTAIECSFTNNHAQQSGGAIFTAGGGKTYLHLDRSTVSGNQASWAGGVYAYRNVLIENSTISGNTATGVVGGGYAGGLRLATSFSGVTFTIRNSTLSGNKAQTDGGGIHSNFGTLVIQNSTITANAATTGKGGGIFRTSSDPINIDSSIIANNSSGTAPDIFSGGTVTANFSAIGNANGHTISGTNNLAYGIDLKLGPLASEGGPTQTHRPQVGSPLIDAGSNPAGFAVDQRGFTRSMGKGTDIGAVELQPAAKVTSVVINGGSAQRSRVTDIKVTFDQPVSILPFAFQLKRQADNSFVGLAQAINGADVTLTFTGGPVESKSLADGLYTLTVFANSVVNLDGFTLDGNNDGVAGGDYVLAGNTANKLFRLFGDSDGNGVVNSLDFASFRSAFGLGASIFDFNNDGQTNSNDFAEFRKRFGLAI